MYGGKCIIRSKIWISCGQIIQNIEYNPSGNFVEVESN